MTFTMRIVPFRMRAIFPNERAVIYGIVEKQAERARSRARSGVNFDGSPMARPKDGSAPYRDSGQLADSIGHEMEESSGRLLGWVRPQGVRHDAIQGMMRRSQKKAAEKEGAKVAASLGWAFMRAGGASRKQVSEAKRRYNAERRAAKAFGNLLRDQARERNAKGKLRGKRWKQGRAIWKQVELARLLAYREGHPQIKNAGPNLRPIGWSDADIRWAIKEVKDRLGIVLEQAGSQTPIDIGERVI